eukprot:TRINITY_DN1708_c0_g1::TRINITY_DN1708_c0_g1_i1::g.25039::m.25039 TRINITY_DN1708_c0_g1::TRINITY_DN1708_c0_g1_i1::g.25039  ORF type:complete len:772 (+),score=309.82,sp/Q54J66/SYTC1_DICDI/59.25/0.0,tRNA-synt_2b/PF00587.20/5.1e-43,HGTP_anticodon/PF03129.15/6.3e+03,HGTP_anticodon/PF03129.15/4.4e-22,tRNA_SAD/PF07973.9/4.7e-12,TGS/PF02824.16/4.3e-07 TRINITY_DN1708_c0_g1_i1:216-2318(+)
MASLEVKDAQPQENKGKKSKGQKGEAVPATPEPEFVKHRVQVWEQIKAKRAAEAKAIEPVPIKITMPDGSVKEGIAGQTTGFLLAKSISKSLAEDSVAIKVNGTLQDLEAPFTQDCTVELIKFDHPDGQHVFWHSSAHVLGEALELEYGGVLANGPPVEDGFFYNMGGDNIRPVTKEDYDAIQKRVDKIISEKQAFERLVVNKDELREMFKFNKYKLDTIERKVPDNGNTTVYKCGTLIDLCKGPHLPNTNRIKAFKVTNNSSAYWLNDQKNDNLQRVYGVSFPDKKLLKEYEFRLAEAEKRDHRKVGKEQDLFFFHELSPGSCFWLPHGTRIYNKLVDFIRNQYWKRGYTEVVTPNVFNFKLWETSGHAANYKENMFCFNVENQEFGLKPMNCPGHCLMFGAKMRSYKELPIRFADFGVLHRNEISGALTGLTRVRRFQQDDAHIFCSQSQIKQEVNGVLDMLKEVYGIFNFEFKLMLSTRPEKFLGEVAMWDKAEAALADALNAFGQAWEINAGDGAFYGPKIDIQVFDALRRKHQCATIQLDFQLPNRFDLNFVSGEGGETGTNLERPVIIHRAILGSVERMIAILIEHTAGKWPLWLSPRQVLIVPVAKTFNEYAESVQTTLHQAGFYVDVDVTERTLPKKVREGQLSQYNYILVVGAEEQTGNTVNVRTRDNQVHGTISISEFVDKLKQEVAEHK